MSTYTNKQYADVEVIRPRSQIEKTVNKTTSKVISLIVIMFCGWLFFGTLESVTKRQTAELHAQAGEIPVNAQTPAKNPELENAEKALEEAQKKVQSLKAPALVDDKTEQNPKAVRTDEMVNTISSFISQYGNPEVAKYANVFVEECSKVDIHPYFCVAVAQADTSTGKNLTTPYNLGNVGNTDSCPTCQAYTSWEQGIRAIAQTLNNQWLRNATKVCHLSKGGWASCPEGKDVNGGKFYASSGVNWDRNASWAFNWMLGKQWDNKQLIKLSNYV